MPQVILLFALFASLFTLSKTALSYAEPFFLIGSRMLLAGVLILTYCHFKQHVKLKIPSRHWLWFAILGLVNIYLTNIAEIWGLQFMSSAKACLIYSLSPFLASLVAFFVLHERLNFRKWVGLLIGFMGLFPVLLVQSPGSLIKELGIISWPELSLLLAVFCSVYGWILLKKLIQMGYSFLTANGISMVIGGTLALVHSYLSGESWQPIPVIDGQYAGYIECGLWMMLISNVICYNLYGHLLKRFSATFMSFAGLVTPLFASFFGWFFLDEVITWHYFAAMGTFSLGLLLFYKEELDGKLEPSTGA